MSTSAGSVAIEDVSVGDRVVAQASDVEVGADAGLGGVVVGVRGAELGVGADASGG